LSARASDVGERNASGAHVRWIDRVGGARVSVDDARVG